PFHHFALYCALPLPVLHSFPTRRSSDLFLAAGSVIHALSGEQDMRLMGGLRRRIPITFWTMTIGVFAIAGIPPLAGFFSKDEILDRKSTRLNSSHVAISYAVFCLKKKKN